MRLVSVWWAQHGVHPVRIIHKVYTEEVYGDLDQRTSERESRSTILCKNLLKIVLRHEAKFKVAGPSIDAKTRAMTRALDLRLRTDCAALWQHEVIKNRETHHIEFTGNVSRPSVWFKGNEISFVKLERAREFAVVNAEFDGNIINVYRNYIWLAPSVKRPRYGGVHLQRMGDLGSPQNEVIPKDWRVKLKIVKGFCYGPDTPNRKFPLANDVCLKENGHLYCNAMQMPNNHAPYVDFQSAGGNRAANVIFALSALGNVYMIEFPTRHINHDTAFRDDDFRTTTVYSAQNSKALTRDKPDPDPVVQIVTNDESSPKFNLVTLHASGKVRYYEFEKYEYHDSDDKLPYYEYQASLLCERILHSMTVSPPRFNQNLIKNATESHAYTEGLHVAPGHIKF